MLDCRRSLLVPVLLALAACGSSSPDGSGDKPPVKTSTGRIRGVLTPHEAASAGTAQMSSARAKLVRSARDAWQQRQTAEAASADATVIPGEVVVRMKAPHLSPEDVLAQVSLPGFTPVYRGQRADLRPEPPGRRAVLRAQPARGGRSHPPQ